MKKLLLLASLSGLLSLALPARDLQGQEQVQKEELIKLGSTVEETLTLRDLDGRELRFKDLRGKVVLIHFWSTLCPYQLVADPKLVELAKRWKDRTDVAILAIASNSTEIGEAPPKEPPGYAQVREHLKKKSFSFPVYADHGNKIADRFQAQTTPHCFVVDRKGVLVYTGALDDDPLGEKKDQAKCFARDAVEAALQDQPVTVRENKPYGCTIKRVKR